MKQVVRQNCVVTLLAAFLAGLTGPGAAIAGPEQDLQSGIDAFNRGDLIMAMASYRKAADAGSAEAQVRLAYILDYSEDNVEAFSLYRAAAEQGNADGQFGLGGMYAKGEGTERDDAKAVEHFVLAAEKSHLRAIRVLTQAYEDGGLGLPADPVLAGKWLIRGAEIGDRGAMQRVIAAYENGTHGLQANPERAAFWKKRLAKEFSDND